MITNAFYFGTILYHYNAYVQKDIKAIESRTQQAENYDSW